jgi:hypothetical protein
MEEIVKNLILSLAFARDVSLSFGRKSADRRGGLRKDRSKKTIDAPQFCRLRRQKADAEASGFGAAPK